jgi:hypothetical protein|tara:strand:- start:242 stop:415 length:174 start_codon:yes stop_codon:yes gene_type:complete
MKSTFNITVKCETEEERDLLLEVICEYPELARCFPISNVFFSENEGTHWADEERQVI